MKTGKYITGIDMKARKDITDFEANVKEVK
jgi:hypothetical protein